jgi:hypothetical protein
MSDRRQVSMAPEAVTARLRRVAELTRFCRALKARPRDPVKGFSAKREFPKDGKCSGSET